MSKVGPVTTEELIRAAMDETGLQRAECLQIVAKSAAVRALARKYGDRFVLKGGTLLYHVYKSHRASYKDADLAEPRAAYGNADELGEVLTIEEDSFKLRGNEGKWRQGEDMIEGLEIPVEIGNVKKAPGQRDLKITVSLRESEQLDPPPSRLQYTDRMLATDGTFLVNGLTLNELSAEKIIGWSLRRAQKHYADLALIARDHFREIDRDVVVGLVRRKVSLERQSKATGAHYRALDIHRVSDLAKLFDSPASSGKLHQKQWESALAGDFYFTADEEERERPFTAVKNVKDEVEEYWGPVIAALRG